MYDEVAEAFKEAEQNDAVKVAVLTGRSQIGDNIVRPTSETLLNCYMWYFQFLQFLSRK